MSEYKVYQCEITEQENLLAGLEALGVPRSAIEIHERPVNLIGFEGRKHSNKAHVVVRKRNVNRYLSSGLSNDLGFEKLQEGYRTHISDYDTKWWVKAEKKMLQIDGVMKAEKLARQNGYIVQKVEEKEGIRLICRKPI